MNFSQYRFSIATALFGLYCLVAGFVDAESSEQAFGYFLVGVLLFLYGCFQFWIASQSDEERHNPLENFSITQVEKSYNKKRNKAKNRKSFIDNKFGEQ